MLLVLDAVTNGDAARLYERLGWVRVGDVPNFALMPRGEPCSTTYYYRNLEQPVAANRSDTSSSTNDVLAEMLIRDATEADLPAIVDIYNQSIPAGWSTADTQPITVADRVEWFRKFDPIKRPIWVAVVPINIVIRRKMGANRVDVFEQPAAAKISDKRLATVLGKPIHEGDLNKNVSTEDNLKRLLLLPLTEHYCRQHKLDRDEELQTKIRDDS